MCSPIQVHSRYKREEGANGAEPLFESKLVLDKPHSIHDFTLACLQLLRAGIATSCEAEWMEARCTIHRPARATYLWRWLVRGR